MNRVSLIGRITRDPEVRYSQAGVAFLSFSIAVDRQQRDANGQRQADFINCTAFGQQADFMGRYIKKGFMIAVCGRLQTRSYQDQQGQTRYTMDVIVDQVENLTNGMINKIVEINSELPIEEITQKIGDKIAVIKNKKEASIEEVQVKLNSRIQSAISKIINFKLRGQND